VSLIDVRSPRERASERARARVRARGYRLKMSSHRTLAYLLQLASLLGTIPRCTTVRRRGREGCHFDATRRGFNDGSDRCAKHAEIIGDNRRQSTLLFSLFKALRPEIRLETAQRPSPALSSIPPSSFAQSSERGVRTAKRRDSLRAAVARGRTRCRITMQQQVVFTRGHRQ